MKHQKMYLAADSGGSKTIWSLISAEGETIFEYKTIGVGAVKSGILPVEETVLNAANEINKIGKPEGIFMSLGGPNVEEVQAALTKAWQGVPVEVEREARGDAVLYAASFYGCSAVVMCGTGSVAGGFNENGKSFSGGWGPVYGDGGSGGGMGTQALKLFLRYIDKDGEIGGLATLFTHLTQGLDITDFDGRMELKSRAISMSRRELAALAPKIYALAEKGDKTCLCLYEDAAREIAQMAYTVSKNSPDTKVMLCGGFFAEKPLLFKMCKSFFAEKSDAQLLLCPEFNPIVGAKLSVLKNNSVTITNEIFDSVSNKL